MKNHKELLIKLLVLFLVFTSCSKDEEFTTNNISSNETVASEVKPTEKLLKNPYEINNIKEAYKRVQEKIESGTVATGKGFTTKKGGEQEIKPNYVYVRFNPKNRKQELRLKNKKKILVIDYPFEYENSQDYYNSVKLTDDEIPSYWASIPIKKKLPKNIPYEILEEMYIPEKDPKYDSANEGGKTMTGKVNSEIDFINHLLDEAFAATDNSDLLPPTETKKKGETCETCILGINLRAKWRPSGRLTIWDDNIQTTTFGQTCHNEQVIDYTPCYSGDYANCPSIYTKRVCVPNTTPTVTNGTYIPLVGVNVLIRDTWALDSAISDSDGRFSFKEVRAKVKYIVQWDRYEFSIRDNTGVFQAEDNGPKLYKQAWHHSIRGGRMEYRGHIFQAALDFYYHDIGGLSRPPTNGFWNKQMKISAKEKNGDSFHSPEQGTGGAILSFFLGGAIGSYLGSALTSTIRVASYGQPSESVYGTTIHELAHAQHWRFDKSSYRSLVTDAWVEPFFGNNLDNPSSDNANKRRTLETWATGVEIFLTNLRYRRLGNTNYKYLESEDGVTNFLSIPSITEGQHQFNPFSGTGNHVYYTSLVHDLADSFNQSIDYGTSISNFPVDDVSNIPITNVEDYMIGTRSWGQLRQKVVNDNSNQAADIITLFNNW